MKGEEDDGRESIGEDRKGRQEVGRGKERMRE
jgi:hypothetical protein